MSATWRGYGKPPLAARWQDHVVPYDYGLTEAARASHPTVVWWWGGRAVGGTFGGWCYLCDAFIITWHRAYPITQAARAAILVHRDLHRAGTQPIIGPHAAVKSAAASGSTNGGSEQ